MLVYTPSRVSLSSSLLFLFSVYSFHRDLHVQTHSFPTIRSSDLQRFERLGGALASQDDLAHMADVEQARTRARPQVFGHDAFILDRHVIAGELDHPRV